MKKTAKDSKSTPATKKTRKASGALEIDPLFAPVVDAFAKDQQVTCGKMMSAVGLKVNGKIFSMLVKGKFVAKLPKSRVDALVKAGKGENFDPGHGRLMKEWIAIEHGEAPWVDLAKEAYQFVKEGTT